MADIQIFEADGRAIPFVDEGTGPAVVIVAERGEDVGYLAALAHSLVEEDFRIVRVGSATTSPAAGPDAAGPDAAGPDAAGPDAAGPDAVASDVVALLDRLGIADAWVGGHGFGGTVARFVALDQHDRVNGVLLFGVEAGDGLPEPAADIPVLVLQGDADDVTPASDAEALRAAAPALVSVVTIEGGGHRFPATHVGATSWAIEDYLDWD
jgi:pimeloyl-ACP methyl ester carboxylesterase